MDWNDAKIVRPRMILNLPKSVHKDKLTSFSDK